MATEEVEYLVVNNIPDCLHSKHLRNFFTEFVETFAFHCFHFIHRPEIQERHEKKDDTFTAEELVLSVENDSDTIKENDSHIRTKSNTVSHDNLCSKDVSQLLEPTSTTNCCVICVKKARVNGFIKMYNKKHWINAEGESLVTRCYINRIHLCLSDSKNGAASEPGIKDKTRCERSSFLKGVFSKEELCRLREMRPPKQMPHGNVGTPTKIFFKLLQLCKLSPSIIKKLGLEFPRNKGKRLYGSVPLQYDQKNSNKSKKSGFAEIKRIVMKDFNSSSEINNDNEVEAENEDDELYEEEEEEDFIVGETFDVPHQKDPKERLFEDDIELQWEKGGSGLVFYTDAQYWDSKEGDFDERTADDWDIDMSVYYDPDGGDKDAMDLMQIRRERKLRGESSDDDEDTNAKRLGSFEMFTKGIGRKLLEKYGWQDGQGLGNTITGIAEPIESSGRHPEERTGLGYAGRKLQRFRKRARKHEQKARVKLKKLNLIKKGRNETDFFISTVYDKICTPEPLPKFCLSNILSCRKKFVKASTENDPES